MADDLTALGLKVQEESGVYNGGPEQDFEIVGRQTLQALLSNGLLPTHKLLDFGCGSLRNGYWLIRFLDEGNYYGIEPVEKGVRAGLKYLVGEELERYKKPQFLFNKNSDVSEFGVPFDYVVARSVFTHACPGMLHQIFRTFASSSPNGTMLASYWRLDLPDDTAPPEIYERYKDLGVDGKNLPANRVYAHGDELPEDDMRFVAIIRYSLGYLERLAGQYGLVLEEDWTFSPINRQIWLRVRKA